MMYSKSEQALKRFINRLALAVAILVALGPALAYLLLAANVHQQSVTNHAQIEATLVSRTIVRNPSLWLYAQERMLESLTDIVSDHRTLVLSSDYKILGERGNLPNWPVVADEAPFHEFGRVVGYVRVEESLLRDLAIALVVLAVSISAALIIYFPLRQRPLAALEHSLHDLRISEARFKALTEMSADWYWEQDTALRFIEVSEGATKAGLTAETLYGKTLLDLVPSDTPTNDLIAYREAVEQKQSFRDIEHQIVLPGGDGYWVSSSGDPVVDEAGGFIGYRGTTKDISLRKRAEHIVRYQDELIRERARQTERAAKQV